MVSIYTVSLRVRNSFTSSLTSRQIITVFFGLLVLKALIAFLVLPLIVQRLGINYVSELFPDRYGEIAENLVNGLGYRIYPGTSLTMLRSPGFVLVLAAIFLGFGKSLLAVQIVQFILSACTGAMIYALANKLLRSSQAALFAAALFLFHPAVMFAETRGGLDITLIFCFTATIFLLMRAIEIKSIPAFVLFGLVFGYTLLVKASVALIGPAIFGVLLLRRTMPAGILIRNFAAAAVAAALVMAPWVIRNYQISGKFVPTMTVGGCAMFQGLYVVQHQNENKNDFELLQDASVAQLDIGRSMHLRMKEDFFPQFYSPQDEVRFYRALGDTALHDYLASPALIGRAVLHNLWSFWFEGRTRTATLLNIAIMVPFLTLCIYGGMRAVRREPKCWLLVAAIIAFMLPHLLIIALLRHALTLFPIMAILAGGALLPKASLGQTGARTIQAEAA